MLVNVILVYGFLHRKKNKKLLFSIDFRKTFTVSYKYFYIFIIYYIYFISNIKYLKHAHVVEVRAYKDELKPLPKYFTELGNYTLHLKNHLPIYYNYHDENPPKTA